MIGMKRKSTAMSRDWYLPDVIGEKYFVTRDGFVWSANYRNTGRSQKLIGEASEGGYRVVMLSINGKQVGRMAHVLVAEVFIGKRPTPKHEVNHKDGNKINNAVENLEWVTRSENMRHAMLMGLTNPARGERSGMARLSERSVREILTDAASGLRFGYMARKARELGVSKEAIRNVVRRHTWRHVSP